MIGKITVQQLNDLEEAAMFDQDEYNELLEKYAGITTQPYTGFSYFDSAGNYLGDAFNCGTMDLLKAAYIEVEREG